MKQEENQKMKSGYDKWKRHVIRRCLNIASDGADVTCDGELFQKLAPETGKTRLLVVERLKGGTASWLKEADRSPCRDGTSVTRMKDDDRYAVVTKIIIFDLLRNFHAQEHINVWSYR